MEGRAVRASVPIVRWIGVIIGAVVGLWRLWGGLLALATLTPLDGVLGVLLICITALSLFPLAMLGILRPKEAGLALLACLVGGTVGYILLLGPPAYASRC